MAAHRCDAGGIAMNLRNAFRVSLFACALANSALAEEQAMPYVLMDEDLAELKSDFNDAVDQVRLVFIVGPT